MYIYKISNTINNKVYIGQTIKPIDQRFHRHILDATNNILDTHLARAIRKYGAENFYIEKIDTAKSQEELTQKEHYWINYYDSVSTGYNETDSMLKCGGNTYLSKTEEEMKIIKAKISNSKLGGKNPQSRGVKCRNIFTQEEHFFDSLSEAQIFVGANNHVAISKRCRGMVKKPFDNQWEFAYIENDYGDFSQVEKGRHPSGGKAIVIKNIETNEIKEYPSVAAASREIGYNAKKILRELHNNNDENIVLGKYEIKLKK